MSKFKTTNRGGMWPKKAESKKHPNIKGECKVKCPDCGKKSKFWLSGWIISDKKYQKVVDEAKAEDKKPRPQLSLSFTKK